MAGNESVLTITVRPELDDAAFRDVFTRVQQAATAALEALGPAAVKPTADATGGAYSRADTINAYADHGVITEDEAEQLRERDAAKPDPLTIRLPDEMEDGVRQVARLSAGEWREVLPGLQAKIDDVYSETGPEVTVVFRLTPQEPQTVPGGLRLTAVNCPRCYRDIPVDCGDLAGFAVDGIIDPQAVMLDAQRLVGDNCPEHDILVVFVGAPRTSPGDC
jgi:hypothetical protein